MAQKKVAVASILGVTIVSVSAVLMATLPTFAHLSYQGIVAGSDAVTPQNPNLTKLSLTATDTIPR